MNIVPGSEAIPVFGEPSPSLIFSTIFKIIAASMASSTKDASSLSIILGISSFSICMEAILFTTFLLIVELLPEPCDP